MSQNKTFTYIISGHEKLAQFNRQLTTAIAYFESPEFKQYMAKIYTDALEEFQVQDDAIRLKILNYDWQTRLANKICGVAPWVSTAVSDAQEKHDAMHTVCMEDKQLFIELSTHCKIADSFGLQLVVPSNIWARVFYYNHKFSSAS